MKISVTVFLLLPLYFFHEPGMISYNQNQGSNIPGALSTVENQADSSCIIEISATAPEKKYNCYMHLFSYKNDIIFTDSNTDYTQYYSPLKHTADHIRLFDRYDSPVGIRKLLVFDTKSKHVLMSDWFDQGASGDSVDVASVNLKSRSFKVWSFESKYSKSYAVALKQIDSW
ncbi:MAG TPA: hypothetical protein VEC12_12585 [Bacteroidia bacterium]|nr:hypothetical protein [Bacteroidia bacterium]